MGQLERLAMILRIIELLGEGRILQLEKYPYPIAMGENGAIGFLYAGDGVVGDFTFSQLFEILKGVTLAE